MKTVIITCLFAFRLFAEAGETNKIFVTDDGFAIGQNRVGGYAINPKKLAQAKLLEESLPSDKFPEGNWGSTQNGFQLSLRFEKTNLIAGEFPVATMLLRNVTNQVLAYNAPFIAGRKSPVALRVIDSNGKLVEPKTEEINIISSRDRKLYPGTQHKYQESLGNLYDLTTNGSYTVYAILNVDCPKCKEVKSAQVAIKISGITIAKPDDKR